MLPTMTFIAGLLWSASFHSRAEPQFLYGLVAVAATIACIALFVEFGGTTP